MIILKVNGGLGNQMFQIANAYQLSLNYNRELFICSNNSSSRPTYWNNILSHFKKHIIDQKTYDSYKSKSTIYNWAMTRFEYKEIILNENIHSYCIEGYYQTYKYFDKDNFKSILQLKCSNNINENDVALHIRRTDYTQNNFHKVLSINYYYNALSNLSKKIKINKIYIFSDDSNWCKQHFTYNIPIEYVNLNNDIEEFLFMHSFSNIIMANSSFSWWASYLSNGNYIYTPKNWFVKGCHLNIKDLQPKTWIKIDDDLPLQKTFNSNIFNIISFGSACCMVQNIHDNVYNNLGPLYRQPDNATNFFDWVIINFKSIAYIFENLKYRDDSFLNIENFTIDNIKAKPSDLVGGWSSVYRKIEHKEHTMIFLHDVRKENNNIPKDFFDKYIRRFERLYNKILDNDVIHFTHCFDFQWLKPYFPSVEEINIVFDACKLINPLCNINLHLLIHPRYNTTENREIFNKYENIKNVNVFYLRDKGFHADWKANNLTFDELFCL